MATAQGEAGLGEVTAGAYATDGPAVELGTGRELQREVVRSLFGMLKKAL